MAAHCWTGGAVMSQGGSMTLEMNVLPMQNRLKAAPKVVDRLLDALLDRYALQAQDTARATAPWRDQTGNARNGLNAQAFSDGGSKGIVLSHAVEYGIYLETMQGGKYRVIMPTLEKMLPQVLKSAGQLLGKL